MANTEGRDVPEQETAPRSVRLLLILEAVARIGVPATPTEINDSIGLPKQTLHRMVASLESDGFLQREIDGRSYSPGPRLRKLATGVFSSVRVRAGRLAVLNALAERIGETCNLAVPDRHAMVYLDRVETDWPLRIQLPVGTKVPFHCTASGKLYLSTLPTGRLQRILNWQTLNACTPNTIVDPEELRAEIDRIRERGYSEDNEEFVEGMVALAAPINDSHDRLVATLSFHAPTPRMDLDSARQNLGLLRTAAKDLSRIIQDDDED